MVRAINYCLEKVDLRCLGMVFDNYYQKNEVYLEYLIFPFASNPFSATLHYLKRSGKSSYLGALNYCHKDLHLRCCKGHTSASAYTKRPEM